MAAPRLFPGPLCTLDESALVPPFPGHLPETVNVRGCCSHWIKGAAICNHALDRAIDHNPTRRAKNPRQINGAELTNCFNGAAINCRKLVVTCTSWSEATLDSQCVLNQALQLVPHSRK